MIKRYWPFFLSIVILSAALFLYFNPPQLINVAGLQIEYHGSDQYASVFLDNQYLEKAPLSERTIKSGDYVLKIIPDDKNLAELSLFITLNKGTLTVISYTPGASAKESSASIYELEPLKNSEDLGVLSFETYPENALLSFADDAAQYTPVTLENLTPKEYTYQVSLPSYQTQENVVQVLPGYKIKATIMLAKLNSTVIDPNIDLQQESVDSIVDTTASDSTQLHENLTEDESWGRAEARAIIGKKVKINSTNFFVDNLEVLRVRKTADKNAKELGFAKTNFYYPYLEDLPADLEATASAQTKDWLKIRFEGQEAWVSAEFAELVTD
ncbi:MAG: hypothetical protein GX559_00615 [Candidatus Pacebacteria bacterium]|nr:hypothetical protein [Candidatus Paceibacterota bacterium]